MSSNASRIIVFSPHPDDDALACGGTVALKTRQGSQIFIAYMTDGRHSLSRVLGITDNPAPKEVRDVRQAEATAAARALSIPHDNLTFLDFEDGTLRRHVKEATKEVKAILESIAPTEIYYPSRRDWHPDHRATNIVVTSAVRQDHVQTRQFEYRVWSLSDIVWAWSSGKDSRARARIASVLQPVLARTKTWGQGQGSPVRVRIADVLELKKAAIDQHKSQFTTLFPSQARPVLGPAVVQRFLSEYEEFREVS
jgi:LmbE family N-acetylglucosaminyl deacetylase